MVVDRQAGHRRARGEERFGFRPRIRVARGVACAEHRRLRLEREIPFLLRREVEQLRRALVAGEVRIVVHVEERRLGRVRPIGETHVDHVERVFRLRAGHVRRRIDFPFAVDERDRGILDRLQRVRPVVDRDNQRGGGNPFQRLAQQAGQRVGDGRMDLRQRPEINRRPRAAGSGSARSSGCRRRPSRRLSGSDWRCRLTENFAGKQNETGKHVREERTTVDGLRHDCSQLGRR